MQEEISVEKTITYASLQAESALLRTAADGKEEAEKLYETLVRVLYEFERNLPQNLQAGGNLASFGQSVVFQIENIGYCNPSLIRFCGALPNGSPIELVQHVSQLNILLVAVERQNPEEPRRQIGFCPEI